MKFYYYEPWHVTFTKLNVRSLSSITISTTYQHIAKGLLLFSEKSKSWDLLEAEVSTITSRNYS